MAIEWNKRYEVGVEKIDSQHIELFDRINKFLDACSEGVGWEAVREVLEFLEDYVVTHFRDEEELQLSSGYPGYDNHRMLHEQFMATFKRHKDTIEQGVRNNEWSEVVRVNRWLVDWLINHIGKQDKKVGEHIASVKQEERA